MKSTLVSFIVIFLITSFELNAQFRMTPKERADSLKVQLGLSKEQYKKVDSILVESDKSMTALRESGNDNFSPESREKFRKIMDETNSKIEMLLNKNQKAKFKKLLEEQRERFRRFRENSNQ
jgi:hypothetical protein